MLKRIVLLLFIVQISIPCSAGTLPSLREQHRIQQEWLDIRLNRVLPELMKKHGISMWIVISREYNEDPLFYALSSADTIFSRRRTIYAFFQPAGKKPFEKISVGGSSNEGLYTVVSDDALNRQFPFGESQWSLLKKVIEERNPQNIAIDVSTTFALADGLSAGQLRMLEKTLGEKWKKRFVPAEKLAMDYLQTRIHEMESTYQEMMKTVHDLISRAFSNEVITPGKSTTEDVVWWLREETQRHGYGVWFQPTVWLQHKGLTGINPVKNAEAELIQRGDVLHTDFGISAMGLNTDTQHMGYVLGENEKDVPAEIKNALKVTNRLQDIVVEKMKPGQKGNSILTQALAQMKSEGIDGKIYCHPIGQHGHGAGTIIGLWDHQAPVPERGDLPLRADMWFSVELSAYVPIPEWGNEKLWVGQEEDVFVGEKGPRWVLNRQVDYHVIK